MMEYYKECLQINRLLKHAPEKEEEEEIQESVKRKVVSKRKQ
jgi:hypothetical protein